MKKKSPYLEDYFAKKAKKDSFAARSVFKLEEIDKKYRLLTRTSKVLDLGASPGSWSQYCFKATAESGLVVSVDLNPLAELAKKQTHLFIQGDAFDLDLKSIAAVQLKGSLFDLVISDMAPKTSGIKFADQAKSLELCERALAIALTHLNVGGHFVCKLFHSNEFKEFETQLKRSFKEVHSLKPKSTRSISKEIFFIAKKLARPDGFEPPTA